MPSQFRAVHSTPVPAKAIAVPHFVNQHAHCEYRTRHRGRVGEWNGSGDLSLKPRDPQSPAPASSPSATSTCARAHRVSRSVPRVGGVCKAMSGVCIACAASWVVRLRAVCIENYTVFRPCAASSKAQSECVQRAVRCIRSVCSEQYGAFRACAAISTVCASRAAVR